MLREIDALLWALRRDGFAISTATALDAVRAIEIVGLADKDALCDALAAVVVERRADQAAFRESFDRFFDEGRAHVNDLFGRLLDRGFSRDEIDVLRQLLDGAAEASDASADAFVALRGADADLERLLRAAGIARALAPMTSAMQAGFFAQQIQNRLGIGRAASALVRVRAALRDALGDARGDLLADAVATEFERVRRRVREHVDARIDVRLGGARDPTRRLDKAFLALSTREIDDVRRAVRALAERLRGAERVRRRRAMRGRIDVRRTLRKSLATGGVPFEPLRRARRRDKPRLVLLCDVSESVRAASLFLLEFVAAAHDLFAQSRSFVFVSEVGEVTKLFEHRSIEAALARIFSGEAVSLAHNSNYGRALDAFARALDSPRFVDRRTTIVILGDGRTNYLPDRADLVRALRDKARALLWITPEAPGTWGSGDSAMLKFAAASTKVLVARTARELEIAARVLVRR